MGRRKIEIKAIKDDRNRSVTFLKRKGGLFKKAHELSVLCSVDVAVFIFGSNKKLYEYSSADMRELITRYTYHGSPTEHKGPSDFNGGAEDEEEEEDNGTPPQGDGMDNQFLHPHYQSQAHFSHHMRQHTPSASPPVRNRAFGQHAQHSQHPQHPQHPHHPHHPQHPVHTLPRGPTPQPRMDSRPASRNAMGRMGANMAAQPVGPRGPPQAPQINGYAYMSQPAMYDSQVNGQNMAPTQTQYQYGSQATQASQASQPPQAPHQAQPPQAHSHHMQSYMEDQRRSSMPPNFPPPNTSVPGPARHSASPPQVANQPLPAQAVAHMSPPQPPAQAQAMHTPPPVQCQTPSQVFKSVNQHQIHPPPSIKQEHPSASYMDRLEAFEKPRPPPLLNTAIKRKQGSIFTPVDENRSVLSQHLAAFNPDVRSEPTANASRTQLVETAISNSNAVKRRVRSSPQRRNSVSELPRKGSMTSADSSTFSPPSRSSSLRNGGGPRPQLKVQIPDEASDAGDAGSATAESSSPRGTATTDSTSQRSRRLTEPHSTAVVLPPPSPSASGLLSAGASGPPNPFARPPPHQSNCNLNVETPVSALPSRFLNHEFLPSPSSFYPEWNYRCNDSNTLPSPLNFTTPLVGVGLSFLREEPAAVKRKSPEMAAGSGHDELGNEPKRIRVPS